MKYCDGFGDMNELALCVYDKKDLNAGCLIPVSLQALVHRPSYWSFNLNSLGGVAILITKITQMLQYGLTYAMQTSGCIRIPDPSVCMSDLAQFDIPTNYTMITRDKLQAFNGVFDKPRYLRVMIEKFQVLCFINLNTSLQWAVA